MVKITSKQAGEFLEKINEKDKIAIFTHKDLDGFAAGSLLYNFGIIKKAKIEVFIIDYGVNSISEYDLKSFNKIILSDLPPMAVSKDLSKLKDKKILYTDHHQEDESSPIAEFILELRTKKEEYIPSSRTCYELTEKENQKLKWLGVLGTLSDMGQLYKENMEFLTKFYKENNTNYQETFEFTKLLNDVIVFFSASIDSFYKIAKLKKITDIYQLEEYYKPVEEEFSRLEEEFEKKKEKISEINYFYLESKFKLLKSPFITGLSEKEPNKIYIISTPKKENLISISGRNQAKKYNVLKIMQDCLNGLKDGMAGGHISAAGGQINKSDLEKFKNNLKNYSLENAKI